MTLASFDPMCLGRGTNSAVPASAQILVLLIESGLWRDVLWGEVQLWRGTVHEVLRMIGLE